MTDGTFVVRMMGTIVLGLFGALCLYLALTVPMIAATTPTLFALGAGTGAWFLYPRNRNQPRGGE